MVPLVIKLWRDRMFVYNHGKPHYNNGNCDHWNKTLQLSLWTQPKSVLSISLYQIVFHWHPCQRNFIVFFAKFYCHHTLFFCIIYMSWAKFTSALIKFNFTHRWFISWSLTAWIKIHFIISVAVILCSLEKLVW